jgi:hypothetical protein
MDGRKQPILGPWRDANRPLRDTEYSTEVVKKHLFKDKALNRGTRRTLFLGLARACIRFNMEGPPVDRALRLDYPRLA